MAFRRDALEAINGFDPQYRKAGDDVDVCWRLQQAGHWITFAPGAGIAADDLGPGLYGPSRFYRANGTFNIFHVCNHWLADLLDAAGVPTAPVLATLPAGLFLDLEWRSGLRPLPRE